jgi:hypothetical protein
MNLPQPVAIGYIRRFRRPPRGADRHERYLDAMQRHLSTSIKK